MEPGQVNEPLMESAMAILPAKALALDTPARVALATARVQAPMGWPEALLALSRGEQAPGVEEAHRLTRRITGLPGLGRTEALARAIEVVGAPGSWRAAWFDLRRSPNFLRDEWAFTAFLKALREFGQALQARERDLARGEALGLAEELDPPFLG